MTLQKMVDKQSRVMPRLIDDVRKEALALQRDIFAREDRGRREKMQRVLKKDES